MGSTERCYPRLGVYRTVREQQPVNSNFLPEKYFGLTRIQFSVVRWATPLRLATPFEERLTAGRGRECVSATYPFCLKNQR
ncbi:protein of unknown function [Methylocaldum szegediense]|uniref:Uncharacterized protein n=1 Tax=Methylocaldum szegediense TaxID=73780 RepID=A0ABM9I875_9GAMM|nr:protein of unknown function [Methylocaldum szegediense]